MSEVAQESDRSKPVRLDVQIPPEMDDHIQAAMAEGGWTSKAKFVRECIHRTLHGESAEDPIVTGLRRELDAVREERDSALAALNVKTRALSQTTEENRTLRARHLNSALDLAALDLTMDVIAHLREGGTHTLADLLASTEDGWRMEGYGPWLEALFARLSQAGLLVKAKGGVTWVPT